MMKFPSRDKFKDWLASHPPTSVVGETCSIGKCPLARFLEANGARDPYVRPDASAEESCWRSSAYSLRRPLPKWANEFAKEVDLCGRGMGIYAGMCLKILLPYNGK